MNPIKKGMTEAVTRDGRKVTQLTWFDAKNSDYSVHGVVGDTVLTWTVVGNHVLGEESKNDIFASAEYEWQWLAKHKDSGVFDVISHKKTQEEAENNLHSNWVLVSRIEESKRVVQS